MRNVISKVNEPNSISWVYFKMMSKSNVIKYFSLLIKIKNKKKVWNVKGKIYKVKSKVNCSINAWLSLLSSLMSLWLIMICNERNPVNCSTIINFYLFGKGGGGAMEFLNAFPCTSRENRMTPCTVVIFQFWWSIGFLNLKRSMSKVRYFFNSNEFRFFLILSR